MQTTLSYAFLAYLHKPIVLSSLRSLRVRNEVDLVPLAREDIFGALRVQTHYKESIRIIN